MYDSSLSWMAPGQEIDEQTRLRIWQKRRANSDSDYSAEVKQMDQREELYNGSRKMKPLVAGDSKKDGSAKNTSHVRNIVFENIESMISTNIPTPKVTAMRKEDEKLAAMIEHWLRNELDRMPFETMNDMAERTVPMQGGTGWLVEWDNTDRTHTTVGKLKVTQLHPKMFAPQPGVYTGIKDMDWFIIKAPATKGSIRREYGIDVDNLGEEQPELRSSEGVNSQDEMLTKYIGYEKNEDGGIDRFVWVNDTVLENIENYQARHQEVCRSCGRRRPAPGQIISNNVRKEGLLPNPATGFAGGLIPEDLLEPVQTVTPGVMIGNSGEMIGRPLPPEESGTAGPAPAGLPGEGPDLSGPVQESDLEAELAGALGVAEQLAGREKAISAGLMQPGTMLLEGIEIQAGEPTEPVKYSGGACPWCGADDWTDADSEYEEVFLPVRTEGGVEIPGGRFGLGEDGLPVLQPTLIPFYKPDCIPIVLQRNVSVYGRLLGNSDVDAIETQQNTVNRMEQKIIDRLVKAGTKITLPPKSNIRMDTEDSEYWYLDNIQDRQYIATYDFSGNIEGTMAYLQLAYEEARQILGITNSFQGREDRTATSGVAKEFQAAQSAGRLESKRVMKAAAYAELFELMFKFQLAYSDEPRSVRYRDHKGDTVYETFNRYDFLKQDADGAWYWNDEFLFSVDANEALESNRAAMWQETRMNLQSGAFGNPQETETLILFWSKMEDLHYPGAGETRKFLEERLEQEREAMQQMQMMQQMQQMQAQGGAPGGMPAEEGGIGELETEGVEAENRFLPE